LIVISLVQEVTGRRHLPYHSEADAASILVQLCQPTEPEMQKHEYRRGEFTVSTEAARLDLDVIHKYLSEESYWSAGIPRETLEWAVAGSLCFGLYEGSRQVGFARVVTDAATFAYLCDVFVITSHRGQGLGTWLMECVMSHPQLQGLRRFVLATRDAHALYRRLGFTSPADPSAYMHIHRPDLYRGMPSKAAGSVD
jgi:GNAT superfamily N-acetyltransferase